MSDSAPTEQTVPPTATGSCPSRAEWVWLLLLLAAFFIGNLLTCNLYPVVWCDEVTYSEPALNWAKTGNFTTTVWELQPANTFPAAYPPLYALALCPWVKVWGGSVLAVRSFNYLLMAGVAFLLWLACWRCRLVESAWGRLFVVISAHLGFGISYAYRCARPDVLGMLCLMLLLLAFSLPKARHRIFLVALLSALTVWIGLQVALFAAMVGALAWLILRRLTFKDLLVVASGMTAGLASLFLFLHWQGVLKYFLQLVFGIVGRPATESSKFTLLERCRPLLEGIIADNLGDFSAAIIFLGVGCAVVVNYRRFSPAEKRLLAFLLTVAMAVPVFFSFTGHFAFYYAYMKFIPQLLALFVACFPSEARLVKCRRQTWLTRFCVTLLIAAALVGLPLRLLVSCLGSKIVSRSEIQRAIAAQVSETDIAFTDFAAFFEVKQRARVVYDAWYSRAFFIQADSAHDFSEDEKRSLTVLVIRAGEVEKLTNFFGGNWVAVTPPFGDTQDYGRLARLPFIGGKFASYAQQPQNERCQFVILRRAADTKSATEN